MQTTKGKTMNDYNPPCTLIPLKEADKLFFSEESAKRISQAKALCSECAIVSECLQRGMEMEFGIFGGLTPQERKALNNA